MLNHIIFLLAGISMTAAYFMNKYNPMSDDVVLQITKNIQALMTKAETNSSVNKEIKEGLKYISDEQLVMRQRLIDAQEKLAQSAAAFNLAMQQFLSK